MFYKIFRIKFIFSDFVFTVWRSLQKQSPRFDARKLSDKDNLVLMHKSKNVYDIPKVFGFTVQKVCLKFLRSKVTNN